MIPPEYKIVSFDVVSLFTNVPSDEVIDIIIKHIYDKKQILIYQEKKWGSYYISALKMHTSLLTMKRTF